MNLQRAYALTSAFGKSALAGLLVLLLFIAALAAGNPSLHHWLHKDHQSPTHYCLVTALEHGQTNVASVWTSAVPTPGGFPVAALPGESFFVSHDLTLHPERGPPFLS